jgi:hypothetical protein
MRESRVGGSSDDPFAIWLLDSSPFISGQFSPNGNRAELWGYRISKLVDGYAGPPDSIIGLAAPAGRGHALCLPSTGHKVVVTSENAGGNANERWFLLGADADGSLTTEQAPAITCGQLFANTAYAAAGARYAVDMGGGNILLGTDGAWKMVTTAAWSMTNEQLEALPGWYYNGNGAISGIGSWGYTRVPGTQLVRFNGDDRFFDHDFSQSTGTIDGTDFLGGDGLVLIALGANIGTPGWYGFPAIDAQGNTAKVRGSVPDLAFWSPATVATLPRLGNQAGANPPPDKVLTSAVFRALVAPETLMSCIDFDLHGNLWIASNCSNRYNTLNVVQSAHLWRFSAAAVAEGGEQLPDITITLPNWTQPWDLRCAPSFRRYAN